MTTNDNNIMPKLCPKFNCNFCDYNTSKKSSYDNHLLSNKHKKNSLTTSDNENMPKLCQKYSCDNCLKQFNDRAGLWRHKKKCNTEENIQTENIEINKLE